ncbi:HNH endonuclease [Streptomyces griseoluteus]
MRAWLLLATGEDRSRGGDGYDDVPSRHYSWDDTVPNHAALQAGDVIALWDTDALLGVSVIERIDTEPGEKFRYSCPECGKASLGLRKSTRPRYLCWKCQAQFDEPHKVLTPVIKYRTSHAAGWVDLAGQLNGETLRGLCEKPKSQLSMRPMRWDAFCDALASIGTSAPAGIIEGTQRIIAGGHREQRTRARIGQAAFRSSLLETYGATCALTGPAPAAVLEAAHLESFGATGSHECGGLLLRRDVHRLFDLGLIAINPATHRIDVSDELADYPTYKELHGLPLLASPLSAKQRQWIELHWKTNREAPTQP